MPISYSNIAAGIGGLSSAAGQFAGASGGGQADPQAEVGLQRSWWNAYIGTFLPEQDKLLSLLSTPQSITQDVNAAEGLAARSTAAGQAAAERRLAGYGVPVSAEQKAEFDRQAGLSSTLNQVAAANNERQAIANRDLKIEGG